jgi:hypothetical protein
MSNLKRKKDTGIRMVLESSSEEEGLPEPKKPHRPFSVAQISRAHSPSGATSKPQYPSTVKPLASMSNAHHFPKLSSKPSVPPTPRDTPALGTGLGGRSKNITAISSKCPSTLFVSTAHPASLDSGADSSSLPDSPVISTRQKTDQRRTLSSGKFVVLRVDAYTVGLTQSFSRRWR